MKFTLLGVILTLSNHWLDPWKQDSGSNHLKGWSKILHNTLKSNRKTQRLSIKVATFWNKKKDWFFQETRLVFMHGNVFKDRPRNSATFKMELFATIGNGRVYNQRAVVFACCCSNSTIFTGKFKMKWKWPSFESAIRHNLFIWYVLTFFRKRQLLSVSLTFCFISKNNYKNENWYHCWFHPPGFVLTERTINICSEKMLLIKYEKSSGEGVFLKKNKDSKNSF